jgi:hypothetical protein
VAVAGIVATAVVGIAGTGVAWLSARDDRAAQRQLAHDERSYDRRVAAYLDATDHLDAQVAVYDAISNWTPGIRGQRGYFRERDGPPPNRLTSRLIAFGSPQAVRVFEEAEDLNENVTTLSHALVNKRGDPISAPIFLFASDYWKRAAGGGFTLQQSFLKRSDGFRRQVFRFEQLVHNELN